MTNNCWPSRAQQSPESLDSTSNRTESEKWRQYRRQYPHTTIAAITSGLFCCLVLLSLSLSLSMDMDRLIECAVHARRQVTARSAPPLANAPASVGPKLDALVTAASHEARCGLVFKAARTTPEHLAILSLRRSASAHWPLSKTP